jgi:thiol:disulfide interchange protein DsbC
MTIFRHLVIAGVLVTTAACSQESTEKQNVEVAVSAEEVVETTEQEINRDALQQRFAKIGVQILDAQWSEIDSLVELTTNQGVFYTTTSGDYFIPGKLFSLDDNGGFKDVVAERQAPLITEALNARADEMITYPADDEKYVVTVFTDISCGYCLKLHKQMEGYNELGITIRYLAFPRAGGDSDVAEMMANIWSSDDPRQAMNTVKLNSQAVESNSENIRDFQLMIAEQYELGKSIGVNGTPAVYLSNGKNVGGYLSPADLHKQLVANP